MRHIHTALYILMCFCFCPKTEGFPKQIIIIRHAEKFTNAYNEIPFITNGLTLKGTQRAAALAPYFMANPELVKFGPPVAVYATSPTLDYESLRPLETAMPTAEALKLSVNQDYTVHKEKDLIKEILSNPLYDNKNVLICWEHHRITAIVEALGVSPLPKHWPDNVFDWTYVAELDEHGKISSFKRLPQKLMYGDSEAVS